MNNASTCIGSSQLMDYSSMLSEHASDDAPLEWLDGKYPMDIDPDRYALGFNEFTHMIVNSSASAKKISRTKYWDPQQDMNVATTMSPETGYWGLSVGIRYLARVEEHTRQEMVLKDPDWDLGARSRSFSVSVEIPDDVLHKAIMKMQRKLRRELFKSFCAADYATLVGDLNPVGPYYDEVKLFIRTAYEGLMQGQVHCTYGMDGGAPPTEERLKPLSQEKPRRQRRGK